MAVPREVFKCVYHDGTIAYRNGIFEWNWLEGSGWIEMFTKAEISTPGRVERG